MEYSRHGGACCGISVVHGFDNATIAGLDAILYTHDNEPTHGSPGNRLLEAVLTDRQLNPNNHANNSGRIPQCVRDAGGWTSVLSARGFHLVSRFRNSNTYHYCNVFHRIATRESILPEDLPFTLPPVTGFTPPPPEPVITAQEQIVWSDEVLTPDTAEVGLRVRYLHRPNTGSTALLDGCTATIVRVSNTGRVIVLWEENHQHHVRTYGESWPCSRFVYELGTVQEEPEVAAEEIEEIEEAIQEPEPEVVQITEFFTNRRNGSLAGPFESLEEARRRWPRARSYTLVSTIYHNGEIDRYEATIPA